jgi:cell wall-associated NlpC family hydrolase
MSIALGLAALLTLAPLAPAMASPLSGKQAEAAALQAQISALDTKVSLADEAYNVARDDHARLTAQVNAAAHRITVLQAENDRLQAALAGRVNQMYRDDGSMGVLEALLSTHTLADFGEVLQALTDIAGQDAATVDQLTRTEAELTAARQKLVAAQSDAAQQEAVMAANLRLVQQQLASRTKMLAATSADIRQLMADEQARRDASARAQYLAYLASQHASSGGSSGDPSGGGSTPAAGGSASGGGGSSRGAAAVRWAEQALGRPYVWAASGPGSFDCSGLMLWAYAHVGVSLPHSSSAQIGVGSRVAKSDLQPGDLVFFGSPIHHVGMYVGGGEFIESPHTGAVVRIATLGDRGDYAGASRP